MDDSVKLVRPPCDPNPSIAAGLSAHLVGVLLTQAPTGRARDRNEASDSFLSEGRYVCSMLCASDREPIDVSRVDLRSSLSCQTGENRAVLRLRGTACSALSVASRHGSLVQSSVTHMGRGRTYFSGIISSQTGSLFALATPDTSVTGAHEIELEL